ncbi:MAG: hypothetical protein M3498_17115 [Deinococcota bacterium]|jgi:hypothetical protein|nr:hypothetical protein [Deinococcota bacterium]
MREHLLEYQDYVLAYRLRALVGREGPLPGYLSLPSYAAKRLERQHLARELVRAGDYREGLRRVDRLTDELNFGFWHNPSESIDFLRRVIVQGGHRALESEGGFLEELLTPLECAALSDEQQTLVARYYLGLLRASASYLDAESFTRLRDEVESLREGLPIFVVAD